MIVSWNWLKEYVPLPMEPAELEHRLSMAGLNHEGTQTVGDDLAIDLEVTSNRPDCLGHIGVAREIGVLWDQPIRIPDPQLEPSGGKASQRCEVRIDCPDLCPRYTARLIRGVKVGPSPDWLQRRLHTIGISSISNVVDATNYVMMECGQPLHAFDLAHIHGQQIIVRRAAPDEPFMAIDHREYSLDPETCVIADRDRAVALGGVMGGADSEVSDATRDLLIEAADFAQLSIRNTARRHNLHSPSSYRFERGIDPEGIDWASRRCCQLILEIAGGQLAEGVIDVVGTARPERQPIVLRFSQLKRVLGIEVGADEASRILTALGSQKKETDTNTVKLVPPSWRRDLTREIDLVEEVARIHGYEQIPEDASVPMVPSHRSDEDRVVNTLRTVLTACGYDEAITASVVTEQWSDAFSPWSDAPPIRCNSPMLRGAELLRRSLVPSLLGSCQNNQSVGNAEYQLFEIAKVYLPAAPLPDERWMLSLASCGDYYAVKGVLENVLNTLNRSVHFDVTATNMPLLDPARSCQLKLRDQTCGYLGELTPSAAKQFGLRGKTTVAEVEVRALAAVAELIPQFQPQSPYPAITRDLNLILDESVHWADLAETVRSAGGQFLEQLEYRETYRDPKKDGQGKKRLIFSFTLRAADRTLTSDEAEEIWRGVVAKCTKNHQAKLLD